MSPLPFAPPPKDSSLYQQLESTTLQTLTSDQLDTIRAKMFSQGTEGLEDEYRRLLLLGLAADKISVSGPISGTLKIIQSDMSSATTSTILSPSDGEVFLYIGSSRTSATITSGSITYRILINDDVNSTQLCVCSESSSGTGQAPLWDGATQVPIPIYIDENSTFKLKTSGSFSALETHHGFIRVR